MASAPQGNQSQTFVDWRTMRLWQIQPLRDVLVILSVLGLLYLGWRLSIVTVPILLAGALAYLFEPLVKRMTAGGRVRRRSAAVAIILGVLVLVIAPLTAAVGYGLLQGAGYAYQVAVNVNTLMRSTEDPQNQELNRRLPNDSWRSLRDRLAAVRREAMRAREVLGDQTGSRPLGDGSNKEIPPKQIPGDTGPERTPPSQAPPNPEAPGAPGATGSPGTPPDAMAVALYSALDWLGRWMQANADAISRSAVKTGSDAIDIAAGAAMSVGATVFGLCLTGFFFFFMCSRWPGVQTWLAHLVPERNRERVLDLVGQMDAVIAGFIRGRLTISAILCVYFALAYWGIGVGAPLLLGLVVGLLCLVPYAATAAIPVVMAVMWLKPGNAPWQDEWLWIVLAPIGVHAIAQLIDDYVLTPSIQGKHTGMDTPAIVFASLAGGTLAGFFGLLVAIPAAACIKILVREVVAPQFTKWAQGRATDPLPISPGAPPGRT